MLVYRGMKDSRGFMRSSEGRAVLESIRAYLEGRTINDVCFAATDGGIATTLHLDNGETFRFMEEELTLDSLYERYSAFFWQRDNHERDGKEEHMGNRAYLTRTKFESDHDGTTWGWRMGDDYVRSYTDACDEQEIPVDPLELLAKAASEAAEDERTLLQDVLDREKGIVINGSWHALEEIAPTLRRALYGEED